MRHSNRSADDLNRPSWNSLKDNYDKHDIGEAYFTHHIEKTGLVVEEWGIDMRDHDDHLIYDDKLDFRVWDPQLIEEPKLAFLVDVKVKTSPSWMGEFNERHYHKYVEQGEKHGVPAYVVMYYVDGGDIQRGFVTDVVEADVELSSEESHIQPFPDGNEKCYIRPESRTDWHYWLEELTNGNQGQAKNST